MPAVSPKQQRFFGAELSRRRKGLRPRVTGMSTTKVRHMASTSKGAQRREAAKRIASARISRRQSATRASRGRAARRSARGGYG